MIRVLSCADWAVWYATRPMSDSPSEPEPKKPAPDDPTKGDYLALGIGCLVFVIMFVAIVLVGVMRGE